MMRAGALRTSYAFVVLALGACGFDLAGSGVALPGESTTDGGTPDDGSVATDGAQASDSSNAIHETVEDPFDDDAHIDATSSQNRARRDGKILLAELLDLGTGVDGMCTATAAIDLTATSCAGRAAPDAPVAVLSASAAAGDTSLTVGALIPGLAVGDELMIAEVQPTNPNDAGRFELVRVASIAGTVIGTRAPLAYAHDALGRVVVQRVPNYATLDVSATGRLLVHAWDGFRAGILPLRVKGSATIAGTIDANAAGFRVTPRPSSTANEHGFAGESIVVGYATSRVRFANFGGGGAGQGDPCNGAGQAGGGGGHATAGGNASDTTCGGVGGGVYGGANRLTLGSAGGSGGNDNNMSTSPIGGYGGAGGGAILLEAASINVAGAIFANGGGGQGDSPACTSTSSSTTMCWDFAGPGGGGAGGTIRLRARTMDLGTSKVNARGGSGGIGYNNNAGAGGFGRILVAGDTVTGTTLPALTSETFYPTSGVLVSTDLLAGHPPAASFDKLTVEIAKRPAGTKVSALVSTDGATWRPAMPPGFDTLDEGVTNVPIDTVLSAAASFFYRLDFVGDGKSTPVVERVAVSYVR